MSPRANMCIKMAQQSQLDSKVNRLVSSRTHRKRINLTVQALKDGFEEKCNSCFRLARVDDGKERYSCIKMELLLFFFLLLASSDCS